MAKKVKSKRLQLKNVRLLSPGRFKRHNELFKDDFYSDQGVPKTRKKKTSSPSKSGTKKEAARKRKKNKQEIRFASDPIVIPSEEAKSRTPVKMSCSSPKQRRARSSSGTPKQKEKRSGKRANKSAPHFFNLKAFFKFFETELKVPCLEAIKDVEVKFNFERQKDVRQTFVVALVKRTKQVGLKYRVGYNNELLLSSTEIQGLLAAYSQVIKTTSKAVEEVYHKYLKQGNIDYSLTANPLKEVEVEVQDSSDGRKRSLSFTSDLEDNHSGESRRGRFEEVLLRQRRSHFRGAKKWMSIAWDLLDSIKNHSKSYPFHKPVDPQALECEDYYEVIEHPMDLSLIEGKLKNEWYHNMREVIDDFEQMFTNCLMYNGDEHKLAEPCKQVRKRFHTFLMQRKIKF